MKIIDIDDETFMSLIPAPIDEKNICSDALLDVIYDDCRYTEKGCISVGFIDNIATMITYGDAMTAYFLHSYPVVNGEYFVSLWQQVVVSRLTGISLPTDKNAVYILDDEYDLVYGVLREKYSITVIIKFNQKE